jgi:hypothetical protein
MAQLEAFFSEIDTAWVPPPARIRLPIIGSVALMLQSSYRRGTNDGDVLETAALDTAIQSRLLELAGNGTSIHRRTRLYLDIS